MINLANKIGNNATPEVPVFRDKFEYTPMNFTKTMKIHRLKRKIKTFYKGK